MDKTSLYIQKLIALLLVFTAGIILSAKIPLVNLIPLLFLSFGYMTSRITGERPLYLWGMQKSDEYLNKKAGFWILFKWILTVFGFVYDLVVWTIFGIYVLYSIIIDLFLLIKTILYWIIHAIIWFLKLFIPPLVFLYKMFVYYVIRWNWLIYQLSFRNINISINRNFYLIALWGAVSGIFIVMLFFGVGLMISMPSIAIIGVVFALLPVVWSFGEISSLRHRKKEADEYYIVRSRFQSGIDSIRAVLYYFIVFVFLILIEIVFNLLGWIPQAGFSFLGIAINVNTLASLIILFVFVILVFAGLVLPPYVVIEGHENNLKGSINFLGIIGRKFLRYISALIPTALFASVVSFIPAIIVGLSVIITINVKNEFLDTRISMLQQRQTILEGADRFRNLKNIERLKFYKNYPKNIFTRFADIKKLRNRIESLKENLGFSINETSKLEAQYIAGLDSVKSYLAEQGSKTTGDNIKSTEISRLENKIHDMTQTFGSWKESRMDQVNKMEAELSDTKGMIVQLPIVFLLTIIWISVFGGLVLAVILAYLGNAYFELYGLNEDGKPSYCRQIISEQTRKNKNQPLLGFTLLALLIIILLLIPAIKEAAWFSLFK